LNQKVAGAGENARGIESESTTRVPAQTNPWREGERFRSWYGRRHVMMRVERSLSSVLLGACLPLGLLGGRAAAEPAFDSGVRGAIVDAGIGTGAAGDDLMFELGGQWAGLRSVRERLCLLQWDALVAGRGGYLASEHPYLLLVGARETAWAEGGYRFSASKRWSAYAGARLANEVRIMVHPGLALSALDTINNVDGVGGVAASGAIRADFGASLLEAERSLLLVAFVEEALEAAEINTPGRAFTTFGIGARFDIARRLTASVEIARGVTPARADPLLGLTDRTTRTGGAAIVRKLFSNGMWLSAMASLERDTDHVVYAGSGATYDTADAPSFGLTFLYGLPLGRSK